MPTVDEMKAYAGDVVEALNASDKTNDAEFLKEDFVEGKPLPIAFNAQDGTELILELNVL